MFEGFDFTNFWEDSVYALKEYVSESPSDELIASVEQELGYKLPASYIWLMKQHNGGIPVNTCVYYDENVPLFRKNGYRKSGTMILRVRSRDTTLN